MLFFPVFKSFLAGSLSGTCSALLFQPLDLVKTRVQSSINTGKGHSGILSTISSVIKQDSVSGLWKGLIPSVTRCVPGVGIYFSSLYWLKSSFGSENPNSLEYLLIGATARSIAAVAMHPILVLKTRYESGVFNYSGIGRGLLKIHHTEGVTGLFSGLAPTLARDVPFSAMYFMFYSQIKKLIPHDRVDDIHLSALHFSCGICAGILASVVTQPADVMKTHMQLNPKKYHLFRVVVLHIYQNDGLTGFFRGLVPRTLRRCLMAALAWTVYEKLMSNLGIPT